MQGDTSASGNISGHRPTVYSFDKDIYPGYGTFDHHLYCFGFIRCYGYIPDHSCHRHSGCRNNLPVTIQYAGDIVNHLLQRQKIGYTVKFACEALRFVGNNYDQNYMDNMDMFAVLLGEEWMPTVPYFEAVCLAGLFSPIALTAYNVLKARCKGPLIVRLEVVKKIIMTAIFAVTIPHSVMAVVWGLVAIAFCEMAVNFLATMRFTSLTFRRFVRTLLPVALVSGTMYLLVRLTAAAIPGNDLVRLLAELATGVVSYLALSALFRLEAFREVTTIVRRQLKK